MGSVPSRPPAETETGPMLGNARGMECLLRAVQELSLARDLASIMCIVRRTARELTGSDGATFVLRDGDLSFYADEDAIGPLWRGRRFPMRDCVSGLSMIERQAIVIEDVYGDPRIPIDAYRPTFVKSLAMVPIRTAAPIGAIGNYWATNHRPSPAEVQLVQALADSTSVAIENVHLYEELERRVHERTADLELANQELEAFNYSVSHDLRAPLRAIAGFSRVLHESHAERLDDEGRRFVEVIRRNAARMDELLSDLMTLSRFGRQLPALSPVDMRAVAAELAAEARALAPERAIDITIEPLPAAVCDRSLIRQVWINLLENAVKYSRGRARTTIEVGGNTTRGENIYWVRDNGAGFDPAHAHRLFAAFQRLHDASEFEGTGIGLAIAHRILRRHGGRIWADANTDQGATFSFALPIRTQA